MSVYNVKTEVNSALEYVCYGQDGGGHHFGFFVAVSHASKALVICITGPSCIQVCGCKHAVFTNCYVVVLFKLLFCFSGFSIYILTEIYKLC